MGYIKKISTLEDMASAQVATNLCEDNGFKEVALCLEKPTYGNVGDMKKPYWVFDDLRTFTYHSEIDNIKQWDAAIDVQCQRLMEGLPLCLRQEVYIWINRIALEYLSYSRRQEELFGVSRYFLMNIFTRGDWKEAGRLDEKKLAERLLEDERLTVLQKYHIACVYCLHVHIPPLWSRLTQEERRSISGNDDPNLCQESHSLVLLWSYHMDGHEEEEVTKQDLWTDAAKQATSYGNSTALMQCWKRLREYIRQEIVIDMALESLRKWQSFQKKSYVYNYYKEILLSNELFTQSADDVREFNLPSYYSELMHFFLSEMDEEQQVIVFRNAFHYNNFSSILECFLDWPHQDNFLPTINRLWGIIPKYEYGKCLLTLASKYSRDDDKENRYYDYRSLLWTLWEETPKRYKRYVFLDKKLYVDHSSVRNKGEKLLCRLLERSPFQEKDEALFKLVFRDQPQEERRVMMRSEVGENICSILMKKEKWSFVNWLLEECLPKEEILSFKKQFIQSCCGFKLCLDKLEENRERLVEDLIDWSLELDTEKTHFKYQLISGIDCLSGCESLLCRGEFAVLERMINFCVSSDEKKEQLKVRFAKYTCHGLLRNYAWEQMDTIIAWCVGEEKIRVLKKDLFSNKSLIDFHYQFVFFRTDWEEIEHFYKWFDLSPEEIKKLKEDTIFIHENIERIVRILFANGTNWRHLFGRYFVARLRWCLTDEEMVIKFKKEIEKKYSRNFLTERVEMQNVRLDYLVSELLYEFRKGEFQDNTSSEGVFVKDKGEKRSSVVIEDQSSSPRKRCKSVS